MKNIHIGIGLIEQIKNCHYYTNEEIKEAVKSANNMLQRFENYGRL